MLVLLLVAALIGAVLGWVWYRYARWGPRTKAASLVRGPLPALRRWGFEPTADAFAGELVGAAAKSPFAFVGTVNGYATEISFGWVERPHVLVRVFFDPGSRHSDEIMAAWRARRPATNGWNFGESFFCAPVYADARLSYYFQPPAPQQIVGLAEQLTEGLLGLGVAPIAYRAGCALAWQVLAADKSQAAAGEQKG